MKLFNILLTVFMLVTVSVFANPPFPKKTEASLDVKSPDGVLNIHFQLNDGVPVYSVQRANEALLNPSALGFNFKDLPSLSRDFKIASSSKTTINEIWQQPWGEVKDVPNHYNGLTIFLEEQSGARRKLNLYFRAYNDGIAFRYEIPAQPAFKNFVIMDELTEFAFNQDLSAWWIPAYGDNMDSEYLYKKNNISELNQMVHTPLTMSSNKEKLFVSIHEAALMDYAAMTLAPKGNLKLKCELVPWANGNRVEASAPLKTPWRTLEIATTPGGLITSNLILNLNEPNKLGDVSWIKPGKYTGIWWGMHIKTQTWEGGPKHGATTEHVKEMIDFASEHNLSAVLAEGWNIGWEGDWAVSGNFSFTQPYPDFDIASISEYAKSKNIGLIAHHETGGNIANYERQMEDAFKVCQKYGIHRLKTGYVNKLPSGEHHQGQFMVRHYQKVLEMAARYQVMLDIHEPIKDTGLRRTFPNMMTREGARGTEYEAWSEGNPPEHTVLLPFTRCLGGPFDYTPGIFDIQFKTDGPFRVHTTLAKQLALYVVIYSPLQMAADLPKNYIGNPSFKFIEDVPTDWEETKVLNGAIGEFVTIARKDRNTNSWYIGSITNENERTLSVPLDFLTQGKKYTAEIYTDGKDADVKTNPLPVSISSQPVDASTVLTIHLAPGGGTAIRIFETK